MRMARDKLKKVMKSQADFERFHMKKHKADPRFVRDILMRRVRGITKSEAELFDFDNRRSFE